MTPQRVLLGLLAIVSGLSCLYLATIDVHYQDRNCGAALFRADPNKLVIETGDAGVDDFEQESLITNCDQLILERRFLAALPGVLCVGFIVAGRRVRDRKPDPFADMFRTGD